VTSPIQSNSETTSNCYHSPHDEYNENYNNINNLPLREGANSGTSNVNNPMNNFLSNYYACNFNNINQMNINININNKSGKSNQDTSSSKYSGVGGSIGEVNQNEAVNKVDLNQMNSNIGNINNSGNKAGYLGSAINTNLSTIPGIMNMGIGNIKANSSNVYDYRSTSMNSMIGYNNSGFFNNGIDNVNRGFNNDSHQYIGKKRRLVLSGSRYGGYSYRGRRGSHNFEQRKEKEFERNRNYEQQYRERMIDKEREWDRESYRDKDRDYTGDTYRGSSRVPYSNYSYNNDYTGTNKYQSYSKDPYDYSNEKESISKTSVSNSENKRDNVLGKEKEFSAYRESNEKSNRDEKKLDQTQEKSSTYTLITRKEDLRKQKDRYNVNSISNPSVSTTRNEFLVKKSERDSPSIKPLTGLQTISMNLMVPEYVDLKQKQMKRLNYVNEDRSVSSSNSKRERTNYNDPHEEERDRSLLNIKVVKEYNSRLSSQSKRISKHNSVESQRSQHINEKDHLAHIPTKKSPKKEQCHKEIEEREPPVIPCSKIKSSQKKEILKELTIIEECYSNNNFNSEERRLIGIDMFDEVAIPIKESNIQTIEKDVKKKEESPRRESHSINQVVFAKRSQNKEIKKENNQQTKEKDKNCKEKTRRREDSGKSTHKEKRLATKPRKDIKNRSQLRSCSRSKSKDKNARKRKYSYNSDQDSWRNKGKENVKQKKINESTYKKEEKDLLVKQKKLRNKRKRKKKKK